MKKSNKKGLAVLCVLCALSLAALVFSGERKTAGKKITGSSRGYIAELYVTGVITESNQTYNQEWLMETISDLTDDSRNRGIMLYLDTPGGAVYEADEVYLALLHYKEVTGRPVYAYMAHMAASGGYYIACAADKIFANRNTITGSIGVLFGGSMDATGLLEKLGIKSETFHSGKNKNMLNYNEPLTEEQRAIMQAAADEAYQQFTGIVAESRKLPLATVQTLADGRIYTAQQALSNGLVDGVCSRSQALAALRNDYGLKDSLPVKELRYQPDNFLQGLLLGSARASLRSGLQSLSESLSLQALAK